VSNDEREHPRTLAGATVLQIVPALREEPAARTALNVAAALREIGARALVAAEDGPLVAELTGSGGEWVPLVNATVNPFQLRRGAQSLQRLIASERIDIVHAQSAGGAWIANMAAAHTSVLLVTTLPDVPPASRLRAYWEAGLARGDSVIPPQSTPRGSRLCATPGELCPRRGSCSLLDASHLGMGSSLSLRSRASCSMAVCGVLFSCSLANIAAIANTRAP